MPVTLNPLGDRVVVRPKDRDPTTKNGIVLPDTRADTSTAAPAFENPFHNMGAQMLNQAA